MRRRVLVTGGAGFIGSHVVEQLVAGGYEVAVLDDLSTGKRQQVPAGVDFFEVDIAGSDAIDSAFESFRPRALLHLAAQVSVSVSIRDPVFDARVNVIGSLRLLEAARRHGVGKVVYASSAAAYGPLEELPLREDMRPRPVSCYGASKYVVEHYLRTAAAEWGLEWAALRYANVYGPRQDPHGEAGVVAIFSKKLLAAESPTIFGDGELTRDYVYVGDVAAANLRALELDLAGHPDPVFNVSTGMQTTTNRIFSLLKERSGATLDAVYGPPRPGDVRHSVLDNTRFRELTGWKAEVELDRGLAETVEYFRGEGG